MRLVIDLIRGKDVPEALSILHFSPKHASKVAEKVLRSAVSNLQNKDEAGRVGPETLFVKEVFVGPGPSLKRMLPAPMGRAYRMVKRSNHLTVVIAQRVEQQQPTKSSVKPKAKQSPKKLIKQQEQK